MALLPYQQIGDNLFVDQAGKQFNITKGTYTDATGRKVNGSIRSYVASPFDTQAQKMNDIYNAQKKAQLDSLKQQQTKAVNDLTMQKKNLAPVYQGQRNQADVVNAQNVAKLRELMAANGINASGENITAQSNLASARQTSLNDINNNENQAISALDKQIADVNDPAQQQAIINQIEAARAQAQLDAWNNYLDKMDSKASDWRTYALQKAQAQAKSSGGGSGGRSKKTTNGLPAPITPQQTAFDKFVNDSIIPIASKPQAYGNDVAKVTRNHAFPIAY
jgi:hypothetical protein